VKNEITVNALKYNGQIHRSWKANLIKQTDEMIELTGTFDNEVVHERLGVIKRLTVSYEYFPLNQWYNIFRFHEPEGNLRNHYCNVGLPPVFENGLLNFVDLDIDILVWKDFTFEILDFEEFQDNSLLMKYPKNVIEKCLQTVEELKILITNRQFPFDYLEEIL
jgi:uncharacterized protein